MKLSVRPKSFFANFYLNMKYLNFIQNDIRTIWQ
jgi:hypothetical protein